MSHINERVYDVAHEYDADHVLHVVEDDAGNLGLIFIDGNNTGSVKVDAEGAKKLRLVLQRYERMVKK